MATRMVATARMVGEICSRRPMNICQGRVFCVGGADEEHDDDLVEGGDEGEERAGDHAGQDERHLHLEEGGDRAGAEVGGGADQALVEADQRRGDGDDDEGDAEGGVGEDDAPVGALQAEARVEEVHAGGGDDERHDHRRDQDRHDGAAERHVRLAEADGGEGAEDDGDQRATGAMVTEFQSARLPVGVGEEVAGSTAQRVGRRGRAQHLRGEGEEGSALKLSGMMTRIGTIRNRKISDADRAEA